VLKNLDVLGQNAGSCLAAQNTSDKYGQYSSTDHFFLWACVIYKR